MGQKSTGESQCRNSRQMSGLLMVGTPDDRRDFQRAQLKQTANIANAGTPGFGQVSVGTPGERRDFRLLELPVNVGTFDEHRQRAVRSAGAGTPGLGRDFRPSGVPTYVGTSDVHSHHVG